MVAQAFSPDAKVGETQNRPKAKSFTCTSCGGGARWVMKCDGCGRPTFYCVCPGSGQGMKKKIEEAARVPQEAPANRPIAGVG